MFARVPGGGRLRRQGKHQYALFDTTNGNSPTNNDKFIKVGTFAQTAETAQGKVLRAEARAANKVNVYVLTTSPPTVTRATPVTAKPVVFARPPVLAKKVPAGPRKKT